MSRLIDLADERYASAAGGRDDHRHPALWAALVVVALLLLFIAVRGGALVAGMVNRAIVAGQDGAGGTDGSSGTDGSDGSSGTDGTDGQGGSSGTDGTNGSDGLVGPAGPSGPPGPPGPAGPAGTTGGTLSLGEGVIGIGACDPEIGLRLTSVYDFDRNTFWLGTLSLLRVAQACDGLRLSLGLYAGTGRLLATTTSPVLLRSGGLPEFFVTVLPSQLSARVDARAVDRVTIEIA